MFWLWEGSHPRSHSSSILLGHDARYAIDPTKIKDELGWYPETMFAEGIVKTIRWNLEHQDWIQEVTSGDYQKYYDMMYTKKGR